MTKKRPETADNRGKIVDANHKPNGQFAKGNRAGGRPAVARDFIARCQGFMEKSGWKTLRDMAADPKSEHRYRALELIAHYAYGKPAQRLEHTGPDGKPLIIDFRLHNDDTN